MNVNNLLATGESSKSVQGEALDKDEDENGKCTFNNSNLNWTSKSLFC